MLDLSSGVAEAALLHPAQTGWFALLRKGSGKGRPKQTMFEMRMLTDVAAAMQHQPDAYLSQASFVARCRKESFVQQIRSVFIDLDCYTLGLQPDEGYVRQVVARAEAAGLPAPSYVVASGRGLYAKWVFDQPVGAGLLTQWKMLQSTLVGLYQGLGADLKVRDSARVLRIIGSTNPKAAGSSVKVEFNSGRLHSFEELCHLAQQIELPEDVGGDAQRVISRIRSQVAAGLPAAADLTHLSLYAASREPILLKHASLQALNWRRFLDLRDLAIRRGGIHEGSRDMFLFWMLNHLALANVVTPENFWSEARELARVMPAKDFSPTEDGSLETLLEKVRQARAGLKITFRGCQYNPLYTPSNDYLIDVLEITDEEMTGLKVIISDQEKLRRRDATADGRAERREQRIEWRIKACEMLAAGEHSQAEIARQVGVSRAQISRLAAGRLRVTQTMRLVAPQKVGLLLGEGRESEAQNSVRRQAAPSGQMPPAPPAPPAGSPRPPQDQCCPTAGDASIHPATHPTTQGVASPTGASASSPASIPAGPSCAPHEADHDAAADLIAAMERLRRVQEERALQQERLREVNEQAMAEQRRKDARRIKELGEQLRRIVAERNKAKVTCSTSPP